MKITKAHLMKYRFLYLAIGTVMFVAFQNCSPSAKPLSSLDSSQTYGSLEDPDNEDATLQSNPQFHYSLQETYLHGQITSNDITALYVDGSNYLVGTNFDLAVSINSGSTWQSFTFNDGLTGHIITSIQKIGTNIFLIGHDRGISLFDLSQMKVLTGANQVYVDQTTLQTRGAIGDLTLNNGCAYYLTPSKKVVKTCYSGSTFTSQSLLPATLTSCTKSNSVDFFNNNMFINCDTTSGYLSTDNGQTFSKVTYSKTYNDIKALGNIALAIPSSPTTNCELVYQQNSLTSTPSCLSVPSASYGFPNKVHTGPSYFWVDTSLGIVTVGLDHSVQFYAYPSPSLYINGFSLQSDRYILATGSFGLISRNFASQTFQRINNSLLNHDISFQKVLNLGNGQFVLGSNYGYYSFDANAGTVNALNNKYSLSDWNSYVNLNQASNQIFQIAQIDNNIVASQNSAVQFGTDSSGQNITELKSYGMMMTFDMANLKTTSLGYLSRNADLSPQSYFFDGNDIVVYLDVDKAVAKFDRQNMYTGGSDLNELQSTIILKVSNTSNDYFYGYGRLFNDSLNDKYYVWFPAPSSGKPTEIYKWNFTTKTFDLYSTVKNQDGSSIATTGFAVTHPVLFKNKIYISKGAGYEAIINIQPGTSTVTNISELTSSCPAGSTIDFLNRSKNYLHYSCSIAGTNSKYIYINRNDQRYVLTPNWLVSPFANSEVYGVTEYKSGFYITGFNFGLIDLH